MTALRPFADLSLRERNAARTRRALLAEAIRRMRSQAFDELRVADLCAAADVTVPTFFNHFPTKDHLLVWIILLWGMETEAHARGLDAVRPPLAVIEAVFQFTARKIAKEPRVAAELFARQARREGPPLFPEVTAADRWLWFPRSPAVRALEPIGILGILQPRLERARALGDLPAATDLALARTAIASVFFGVPILTRWQAPHRVGGHYREQLAIVLRGLGARTDAHQRARGRHEA